MNWIVDTNQNQHKFFVVTVFFIAVLLLVKIVVDSKIHALTVIVSDDSDLSMLLNNVNNRLIMSNSSLNQSMTTPLMMRIVQQSKSKEWHSYSPVIKQINAHQIELTFKNITSDDLIKGLENLSANTDVQVDRIDIRRLGNSHFVSAALSFKTNYAGK